VNSGVFRLGCGLGVGGVWMNVNVKTELFLQSQSAMYIYQGFSFNCALALILFLKMSDTTYGNDFIAARSCEMIVVWSPVSSTRSPK
jgi:hypothetical protein